MIGRVIEAKPEELRVFLEEAAGVSKYRERRKETEGRIADTRGNLARVEDIRGELAAQIEKLAAQAEIATRYREHEAQLGRPSICCGSPSSRMPPACASATRPKSRTWLRDWKGSSPSCAQQKTGWRPCAPSSIAPATSCTRPRAPSTPPTPR